MNAANASASVNGESASESASASQALDREDAKWAIEALAGGGVRKSCWLVKA